MQTQVLLEKVNAMSRIIKSGAMDWKPAKHREEISLNLILPLTRGYTRDTRAPTSTDG